MSERAEGCEFKHRLVQALEGGYLSLCLGMGLRSGLLEALLRADSPLSSSQLAERTSCKERYVREWLCSLVACDVVETDVTETAYHVTSAKAKVLKDSLVDIDTFRVCACRLPDVTSFFSSDGPSGMGFLEGHGFGDIMKNGNELAADSSMEEFLTGVPGLQEQLERGIDVAEFACGAGVFLTRLAKRFPASRFHGSDIDVEEVESLRQNVTSQGLSNVETAVVDLCNLPESYNDRFDWVLVRSAMHDLPDTLAGLRGLSRALREGAYGSFQDINLRSSPAKNRACPHVAYLYVSGLMSCLPSVMVQNPNGEPFGIAMGLDKGKELIQKAGLTLVDCRPCSFSDIYCQFVFRK